MADEALPRIEAVAGPGVTPAQVVEAAAVIEEAGFTTVDDLVHGLGGGYLPPVFGSRSRTLEPLPTMAFAEGMTVVVQPNVTTRDGRAGVQTGELLPSPHRVRAAARLPAGPRPDRLAATGELVGHPVGDHRAGLGGQVRDAVVAVREVDERAVRRLVGLPLGLLPGDQPVLRAGDVQRRDRDPLADPGQVQRRRDPVPLGVVPGAGLHHERLPGSSAAGRPTCRRSRTVR